MFALNALHCRQTYKVMSTKADAACGQSVGITGVSLRNEEIHSAYSSQHITTIIRSRRTRQRACSTHGKDEICSHNFSREIQALVDRGVDRKITLKTDLK
jgi:hypothetical protein